MLCYAMLYYTILYSTLLYYTILYYTILYYTILYYTILYYTTPPPRAGVLALGTLLARDSEASLSNRDVDIVPKTSRDLEDVPPGRPSRKTQAKPEEIRPRGCYFV